LGSKPVLSHNLRHTMNAAGFARITKISLNPGAAIRASTGYIKFLYPG
jgi:hypothetical protein